MFPWCQLGCGLIAFSCPPMQQLLLQLTQSLQQAKTLEELARPMLVLLGQVTQLESTYLTTIDLAHEVQHVLYAHNTAHMQIPEGLDVPWQDTLCQRALQEGRCFTADVPSCWGDAAGAQALGIRSYVSMPIYLADGSIFGTLCAASGCDAVLPAGAEALLGLFAQLIGQQIERENLVQRLQDSNAQLAQLALTDALTQLPNRLALVDELTRLLARAQRDGTLVWLAFIDLDGFKAVNDTYGHKVGDRLLCTVAQRLHSSLRGGDLVARVGGDEFVVVMPAPVHDGEAQRQAAIDALQARLDEAVRCDVLLDDGHALHYPGGSIGWVEVSGDVTVEQALQQADAAMYARKRQRRAGVGDGQSVLDGQTALLH